MAKYLLRTCPKCTDYLGVVVRDPPGPKSEIQIDAYCVVCGFKLGWKVVLGSKGLEREEREAVSSPHVIDFIFNHHFYVVKTPPFYPF